MLDDVLTADCPRCRQRFRATRGDLHAPDLNCPACGVPLAFDGQTVTSGTQPIPSFDWRSLFGGVAVSSVAAISLVAASTAIRSTPLIQAEADVPRPIRVVEQPAEPRPVPEPSDAASVTATVDEPILVPMRGIGDDPVPLPPRRSRVRFEDIAIEPAASREPIDVPFADDKRESLRQRLTFRLVQVRHRRPVRLDLFLLELEELLNAPIDTAAVEDVIAGRRVELNLRDITLDELLSETLKATNIVWRIDWSGSIVLSAEQTI